LIVEPIQYPFPVFISCPRSLVLALATAVAAAAASNLRKQKKVNREVEEAVCKYRKNSDLQKQATMLNESRARAPEWRQNIPALAGSSKKGLALASRGQLDALSARTSLRRDCHLP
jgi:hypothetical protein